MIPSNAKHIRHSPDADLNEPIHYAAACVESGPLELLIARGAAINAVNAKRETPLIIATKSNRPKNI